MVQRGGKEFLWEGALTGKLPWLYPMPLAATFGAIFWLVAKHQVVQVAIDNYSYRRLQERSKCDSSGASWKSLFRPSDPFVSHTIKYLFWMQNDANKISSKRQAE
jgi:hypothetical protein